MAAEGDFPFYASNHSRLSLIIPDVGQAEQAVRRYL
jgi:hypothetical protein